MTEFLFTIVFRLLALLPLRAYMAWGRRLDA